MREARPRFALLLVASVVVVAPTAGCGSGRAAEPGCVKVYFRPGASRSRERAVEARVRAAAGVVRVRFVSKKEALAAMRRRYPNLIPTVPFNPLPDALYVRTRDDEAGRALVRSLRPRPRGVGLVKRPPVKRTQKGARILPAGC